MNPIYTRKYQEVLAKATSHNRKRGIKYDGSRWLVLDKDDPTIVHLGFYYCLHQYVPTADGKSKTAERIDRDHWPFIPYISFAPDHMVLTPFFACNTYPPALAPEIAALYPHLQPAEKHGPRKYVDTTLNNLTHWAGIRHEGVKETEYPGFWWGFRRGNSWGPQQDDWAKTKTKIYGPVRYDAAREALEPIWDQPDRVVKLDARKHANTQLREAFTRLRRMARLGVEFTPEEFCAFSGKEVTDLHQAGDTREAAKAQFADWADPQKFLAKLETANFENRQDILEINIRAASVNRGSWWYYGTTYEHMRGLHARLGGQGILNDPKQREQLRRSLHKALDVVSYKT